MDINKYLNEQVIFIMPHSIKKQMLKNIKKLSDIKIYTKEDIKKKILFDYDEKAIHYLMMKYQYKIDICKMYLDNMYYVDDIKYKSSKLNDLVKMKKELINNHLLTTDDIFLNSIKNKKAIVYGYDYIDKLFSKLLDKISLHTKVEIIEKKPYSNLDIPVYEFNEIEDEISFVAHSICTLIDRGVEINNIKIGNVSDNYVTLIDRIFSFYNIPVHFNNNISIYSTEIGLSFIELFTKNNDLQISLDELSKMYDLYETDNMNIYNKIINICNKFVGLQNIKDMIIYEFKNNFVNNPKLDNAVEIINLKDNVISPDNYVFVMNFNQGAMPIVYQDVDYITDDLKSEIGIETTSLKNKIEKTICSNVIKGLNNAVITYKLKASGEEYYPSSLIDFLNLNVIKNYSINSNISYSTIYDKLLLSQKLDMLDKYNELDDKIDLMYHNYKDINYKVYDNQFKSVDSKKMLNYLSPKLKLSYSSLNDYFECAFKYYINHVMKLKSIEDSFYLTIGNLFHYVLSKAFLKDFDFESTWSSYLKDLTLSNKEKFFLNKLHDELKFVIDVINKQNELSTFDKALYEERIYVNLPNEIDVTFSGVIDKIMYNDDDKPKVAVIDYKTGRTEIKLNNVIHGLNMQLPIYLYLISNYKKIKDPVFVGFYLQEILHNEINYDSKKDYNTRKKEAFKLIGYTIDDENVISTFDKSYADSRFIKGLKLTKNGFAAYSKLLNKNQMNNLIKLIEKILNMLLLI